jgi:polyisoprenyl-phosphate glycosyltransferase
MPRTDVFVSVVATLHNDADVAVEFLREVTEVLHRSYTNYELLLVDDGSEDATVARVKEQLSQVACVRLICLSKTFGRDVAITAGLEASIGDFVVVMSPESDPPALIPQIVETCRTGVGILCGVDRQPARRPAPSRWLAALFHAYAKRFLHLDLVPGATDYRVLSRQAVNAITQIKQRYRHLRLLTATVGFSSFTFPYTSLNRRAQRRPRSFWKDLDDAVSLTIANSMHPLRFVSRLGLVASGLNLLYLGYVVVIYLFKTKVAEGWTTLSLQHGGMFFFIFVILTVLCEYVGRILEETRERPLYFVVEEKNSAVLVSDEARRNVVL